MSVTAADFEKVSDLILEAILDAQEGAYARAAYVYDQSGPREYPTEQVRNANRSTIAAWGAFAALKERAT